MDDAWLRGMLDTAARTDTPYNDNPEHEEVIRALAAHEGSLEFMLNILTEPEKDWWPSAVQVIAAIGYPRNKSAIPMLVVHATDPNSPASFDALPALEKLPRSDLIAELASLFWAAQERQQDWEYRVEAACILTTHWGGVVA